MPTLSSLLVACIFAGVIALCIRVLVNTFRGVPIIGRLWPLSESELFIADELPDVETQADINRRLAPICCSKEA